MEPLRIGRIQREMESAARRGRCYHLWWHPHNFGAHPAENLRVLDAVLATFQRLRKEAGMESLSMAAMAEAADGA